MSDKQDTKYLENNNYTYPRVIVIWVLPVLVILAVGCFNFVYVYNGFLSDTLAMGTPFASVEALLKWALGLLLLFVMVSGSVIFFSLWACRIMEYLLNYGYRRANADSKIEELLQQHTSNKEKLREAIQRVGFLSAYDYWRIKREGDAELASEQRAREEEQDQKALIDKYSSVFDKTESQVPSE